MKHWNEKWIRYHLDIVIPFEVFVIVECSRISIILKSMPPGTSMLLSFMVSHFLGSADAIAIRHNLMFYYTVCTYIGTVTYLHYIIITFCSGWYGILSPRGKVLLPEAKPRATVPFRGEILCHITLNKMWQLFYLQSIMYYIIFWKNVIWQFTVQYPKLKLLVFQSVM